MTDKKVSTFSKTKGYNVCQSKLVEDKRRQARSYQDYQDREVQIDSELNSTERNDERGFPVLILITYVM